MRIRLKWTDHEDTEVDNVEVAHVDHEHDELVLRVRGDLRFDLHDLVSWTIVPHRAEDE